MDNGKVSTGRPRLSVDFAIVLRLRDVENLGWSRMAQTYRKIAGEEHRDWYRKLWES